MLIVVFGIVVIAFNVVLVDNNRNDNADDNVDDEDSVDNGDDVIVDEPLKYGLQSNQH